MKIEKELQSYSEFCEKRGLKLNDGKSLSLYLNGVKRLEQRQ